MPWIEQLIGLHYCVIDISIVIARLRRLVTAPAVAAIRKAPPLPAARTAAATPAPTDEQQLNKTFLKVQERVNALVDKLQKQQDNSNERATLAQLTADIRQLDKAVLKNFDAIGAQLKQKHLPDIILARQTDTVAAYQRERDQLLGELDAIAAANTDTDRLAAAQKAKAHLDKSKLQRAPQPFDPNNLPFQAAKPHRDVKPKTTKAQFVQAGLVSNPLAKLASNGYDVSAVAGADDPAYLAETIEVKLTDAVKAKAAELHNNPVQIYNWVRNNVEWLPTWGSLQDADVTLGSLRGNAMDIASLTIALLRASGIPARYVHGTIEVAEDKFRNWAGGFQNIDAAIDFASAGGIPITAVVSGGKIAKVQMEHVWVEAAIDFEPSRGAVNKAADTWVQMDPSFKQYTFKQGLDVLGLAGIDPNALATSFTSSGTVNDAEGWVQNLDPTILANAQTQATTALQNWMTQNPNATVGDVLGGHQTIVQTFVGLPSALANRVIVAAERYGEMPDALRPKIAFGFGVDATGSLINETDFAFAALNNHKVTLSFRPATDADEQALESLIPPNITDPSQLPSSIPAYLVNVVPELKVEGQTVLSGGPMSLGADLEFDYQLTDFSLGTQVYPETVVAGSYLSVAVVAGGVSVQRLSSLKDKLTATQTTLQTQNQALIAGVTREDILGDMFYAGTLSYFAEYETFGQVSAQQQGNHVGVATSAGTYGYVPNVTYFIMDIPQSISTGGAEMDMHRVAYVGEVDGKGSNAKFNLTFQMGALSSALEHAIPQQMFVTPDNPGEAVSAVKAVARAAQEGQRIYHVTAANQDVTLPNIHQNPLAMSEIRNALSAGKEVIIHTDPISVPGWAGAGYVVYDPGAGAGAWKIGGGKNGSYLAGGILGLEVMLMGMSTAVFEVNPVLAGAGFGAVLASIVPLIALITGLRSSGKFNIVCFAAGVLGPLQVFSWALSGGAAVGAAMPAWFNKIIGIIAAVVGVPSQVFSSLPTWADCKASAAAQGGI